MKSNPFRYISRKTIKILSIILSILIIYLVTAQVALSQVIYPQVKSNQKIIEHLQLSVPSSNKEAWLKAEKASWEPWLKKQKGFLGRQLYWDPQQERATLLISWSNRSTWQAIPKSEINYVQELFEEYARNATGIQEGNPFPLLYEGELIPQ
tara:strand:- start:1399 stop:1854 length:456 start_codon:yes stop_codon:yes gene_type:complete